MKSVTVAVIEDDEKFRKEFVKLLAKFEEIEKIVEFDSAEECLSSDLNNISFYFIDLHLKEISGIELLIKLSEITPDSSKIIVSKLATDEKLFECLRNGAVGYIIKSDMIMIWEIISSILNGGFYISPTIAIYMIKYFKNSTEKINHFPLTETEYKVLLKLADGLSVDGVSKLLGVKKTTIQFHVRGIYKALQVSNRAQMLRKANELKIIP